MKTAALFISFVLCWLLCGCQATRFYSQAFKGQYQIFAHQKSVASLIGEPQTSPELKAKLIMVMKMREFAEKELKLPVKNQYLKYVDLHRPFAVWTVTAAPTLSLEPKTWWYPIVGRASYRGYFSREGATNYAAVLKRKGFDVSVGGVETYSTLGWFRDPLLSTFLDAPEAEVADTLFHELAHQKLFVAGDTVFNETFATAVAEEGVRRWYLAQGKPDAVASFHTNHLHETQFIKVVLATRQKLGSVYEDPKLSDSEKLDRKKTLIAELQRELAALKKAWGGDISFDGWLDRPVNNARLGTVSSYYELVPAFQKLLQEEGGDLEKFYARVKDLSAQPLAERHRALEKFQPSPPPSAN